jgi:type I restriction enzyme S subunit
MLKGYREYKETDYDWLPQIPSHWNIQRAKTMYQKMNRDVDRKDEVITCFRDGTVTLRKNRRTAGFTESIKEIGYQGIKKGDLIIHVMDAFAGAIGVSDSNGKGTPVYSVCTAKGNYNNYYYAFVIREMAKKGFIQSLYRGIRERSSDFRYEVFGKQLLPIPPHSEQDQIVRYLEWKVSMINKYINAKKKLIELLRERKQVVINQAVTRDYAQKFRFRHLFTLIKGLNITKADLLDFGVPCVNYGEIHSRFSFEVNPDIHILRCADIKYLQTNPKSLIKYGDFVFADTSEDIAGSGNFTYLNSNTQAFAGYHTIIARPNKAMNYRYLAFFFDSLLFRKQIQQNVNGVKVYSITRSILNDTYITLPSVDEQQSIMVNLNKQCEYIDKLVGKLNGEITLFTEYRTRLISDVVTGKVNVQNVKVPEFEVGNTDLSNIEQEMAKKTTN